MDNVNQWHTTRKQLTYELTKVDLHGKSVLKDESLSREVLELERSRQASLDQTKRFLSRFKADLQYVKESLGGFDGRVRGDVQNLLETFERKIVNYKRCMREEYENLVCDEKILDRDIGTFAENIESLNLSSRGLKGESENKSEIAQRLKRDLQKQSKIGAIDKQIANLGSRNGKWDGREHDLFMKLMAQNHMDSVKLIEQKYADSFIKKCLPMFPGKTEVDIKDHIDFFLKYTALVTEKRSLLQFWREDQKKKKDITMNVLSDVDDSKEGCSDDKKHVDRRLEVKKRISVWRQEQIEANERAKIAEANRLKREKAIEAEERARRQASVRNKLDIWKQTKACGEEKVEVKSGSSDPEELKRFRDRDLEFQQKRKEKITDHQKLASARETRILESRVRHTDIVGRDPSRLLQATAASAANKLSDDALDDANHRRLTCPAHSTNIAMGGYDLKFSGRAQPSWTSKGAFL